MNNTSSLAQARQMHGRLLSWLIDDAYPLWATSGFDSGRRAFNERLTPQGALPNEARRARVQARQVYAYSRARSLGWHGDARPLVEAGLNFFIRHYLRADGLFHTLVEHDGVLDGPAGVQKDINLILSPEVHVLDDASATQYAAGSDLTGI